MLPSAFVSPGFSLILRGAVAILYQRHTKRDVVNVAFSDDLVQMTAPPTSLPALAGIGFLLAVTAANAETRLVSDTDGVVISNASPTPASSPLPGSADGSGAEGAAAQQAQVPVEAGTGDLVPASDAPQAGWKGWLATLVELAGGGAERAPRPRSSNA
jgi:hypothetical protein